VDSFQKKKKEEEQFINWAAGGGGYQLTTSSEKKKENTIREMLRLLKREMGYLLTCPGRDSSLSLEREKKREWVESECP